ncbi:MAG: 3-hydroxybutyryl-CoA dehydrogenase [Minwuia sp.]|uniref:3-hydroxybutyryl-CoA dehydrogenase n=1 Tax=Minwuia sp. TaxID=2493630 RepID=UPI003A895893
MNRVALYGAGRMGRGLAHVFAWAGWQVTLIDGKDRPAAEAEALLGDAATSVRETLSLMLELGGHDAALLEAMAGRIRTCARSGMAEPLAVADLVMEGAPETAGAKADALAEIARAAPDAIVASTTSTMLSSELAGHVRRPERFLNAHWLNPAYLIPLVEVSPHDGTDEAVTATVMGWLEEMGKQPVRCAPSPGFIVPRIQALAMNEAARMVEEGVASAEDIDRAIRTGFGVRFAVLGLLEFIDWGGGDILYHASRYMAGATGEDRFRAPEIVDRMMAEGRIGMDAGEGFYDFRNRDVGAYRRERLEAFHGLLRHRGLIAPPKA